MCLRKRVNAYLLNFSVDNRPQSRNEMQDLLTGVINDLW